VAKLFLPSLILGELKSEVPLAAEGHRVEEFQERRLNNPRKATSKKKGRNIHKT